MEVSRLVTYVVKFTVASLEDCTTASSYLYQSKEKMTAHTKTELFERVLHTVEIPYQEQIRVVDILEIMIKERPELEPIAEKCKNAKRNSIDSELVLLALAHVTPCLKLLNVF